MSDDMQARQRVLQTLRNAGAAAALVEYADKMGYGRDSAMWEFADLLGIVAEMLRDLPTSTKAKGDEILAALEITLKAFEDTGIELNRTLLQTSKEVIGQHVEMTNAHTKLITENTRLVVANTEKALVEMVKGSVHEIAQTEASGRYWKGIGVGLMGAAFLAAVCGIGGWWVAKSQYEKTMAESAAWVNSPSGQAVINCTDKTWVKKKQDGQWACLPDGNVHGWYIP